MFKIFFSAFLLALAPIASAADTVRLDESRFSVVDLARHSVSQEQTLAEVSDNEFRDFIGSVTRAIAIYFNAPLEEVEALFQDVTFVRVPFFAQDVIAWTPDGDGNSGSGCHISSPWMEMTVSWDETPSVSGTLFWNERQIILDILGPEFSAALEPAPRAAFSIQEFERLLNVFKSRRLQTDRDGGPLDLDDIPVEMRLLLKRFGGYDFPWGLRPGVRGGLWKTIGDSVDTYVVLTLVLLDDCLMSGADISVRHFGEVAFPN